MQRRRHTLPVAFVILAALVGVIVSAAGGGSRKARPTVPGNSAISVVSTPDGPALADANGRTLYLFAGDTRDLSRLSAAGRAFWPPLTSTTRPTAQGGALASQIGSVRGATGAAQVTYNGHPLYYFVGDRSPGQATGQGLNQFGARWYVLSPAGTAITSAPRASAPSTSGGGGYTY
jgi:predicted lipoprotein with Yx(FWY)xxD motif